MNDNVCIQLYPCTELYCNIKQSYDLSHHPNPMISMISIDMIWHNLSKNTGHVDIWWLTLAFGPCYGRNLHRALPADLWRSHSGACVAAKATARCSCLACKLRVSTTASSCWLSMGQKMSRVQNATICNDSWPKVVNASTTTSIFQAPLLPPIHKMC